MNATKTIREAAQQMRQRAINATGLNWNSDHGEQVYTVDTDEPRPTNVLTFVAGGSRADIAHATGWGPATALAVADLLDHAADDMEEGRRKEWHTQSIKALALARAYLDAGWDGDPFPR